MYYARLGGGKKIAIVLRGDRGLEPALAISPLIAFRIAIVLRGDRGLELLTQDRPDRFQGIAIVLRGDRGLEPPYIVGGLGVWTTLRSFFGAIEDWNQGN